MKPTLVILVVGLAPSLVGADTPHLKKLADEGAMRPLNTVTPAVTCTAQSTLVTGLMPSGHGAVANGWYFRDLSEVWLWRQSNRLVGGEKIWEAAKKKDPDFTCAKMFWWYNMYSSADWSATPRPMYPADGRKIPDHYAWPPELHDELDAKLGQFPLFTFWGPVADISSSDWITKATLHVMQTRKPTLALTYLPHLDYNLQRLGPDLDHPRLKEDLREVDACCGELIDAAEKEGRSVIVVSEYGITSVTDAVHINRALRKAGSFGCVPKNSAAKSWTPAHPMRSRLRITRSPMSTSRTRRASRGQGVDRGWMVSSRSLPRMASAPPVSIIRARANWWRSRSRIAGSAIITGWTMTVAPDFARTVDIHRKPGYDPVELFFDPAISNPKACRRLASRQKKARSARPDGCDLAEGHAAGQRLTRPPHRRSRSMDR